ncbi:hypothetical protein [Streptomyces purpurascens]
MSDEDCLDEDDVAAGEARTAEVGRIDDGAGEVQVVSLPGFRCTVA